MNSSERTLITTSIQELWGNSKNVIFLGEWCKKYDQKKIWNNLEFETMKHHWTNYEKLYFDRENIMVIYEKILNLLVKKLNAHHKTNHSSRYWRIIIGPWLVLYTVCMFDKWETLRIFFERYKGKKKLYTFDHEDNIFYNYGTLDFWEKTRFNDIWHYKNFLRIINFKFNKEIKIKKIDKHISFKDVNKFIKENKKTKTKIFSSFKSFFRYLIIFLDRPLSFFGIRINDVIIESFYFDKRDLIKLFFKSRIFPSFYINTFKEKIFDPKEIINLNQRKIFFDNNQDLSNDFEKYLFFAMKTDFPIAYLEKFNEIDRSNSHINKQKKKSIFSMTSYMINERFKIWLARMVSNGAKLNTSYHGGCIPCKIDSFLDHNLKISDKYFVWSKKEEPEDKKHIQASPVQLLKAKRIVRKSKKLCLIVSTDVLKYPIKFQSCPYAEQSKILFNEICSLVNNLKSDVYKNVVYRCQSYNWGYDMPLQFSETYKDLKIQDVNKTIYYEDLSNTKLLISADSSTAGAEGIMSNIPTVITYPTKLYHPSDGVKPILEDLKKNKIFFEDPIQASKHINEIWHNPEEWWNSEPTRKSIIKLKDFAFNLKNDWKEEWSNIFKREKGIL